MRIARDFGTVAQLLPEGCQLIDAPHPFVNAINMALTFLSWQENVLKKEQPPKRIWLDGEKLDAHFKLMDKRREEETKSQGNDPAWRGEMVQNDAASMLITE